jgi:hypothetical protein
MEAHRKSRRLRLSLNFINNEQSRSTMKTGGAIDITENGPSFAGVGQYYTLYDGVSKERYESIVASAPFDKCNLLILWFVPTFKRVRPSREGGTIYVAQLANGRDPTNYPVDPSDTDGDRVKLIVQTARNKCSVKVTPAKDGKYKFVIKNAGGDNTVTFEVKVAK